MRLRGLGVHIVVAVVGLPFFSSSLLGDGAWLAGVVLARFVVFGPGARDASTVDLFYIFLGGATRDGVDYRAVAKTPA